jgi:putative ATP-binding cassette transporter
MIKKLILFLINKSKLLLGVVVIVSLVSGLTGAAVIYIISRWLTTSEPITNINLLYFGILIVGMFSLDYASKRLLYRFTALIDYDLKISFSQQILATPLRKLEEIGNPRLMALLTDDVWKIISALYSLPAVITSITVSLGCVVYMVWLSPYAVILLAVVALPIVGFHQLIYRRAKLRTKELIQNRNKIFQKYEGLIEGVKELKVNLGRRLAFFNDSLVHLMQSEFGLAFSANNLFALSNAINQGIYFFIILILFAFSSTLDANQGVLVSFTLIVLYMRNSVIQILNAMPTWTTAVVTMRGIEQSGFEIAPSPPRLEEKPEAQDINTWSEVNLTDLTHTYYSKETNGHFTLGPINLTFTPGELVFLIGGNGSGKTTLIKLLTGLYQPENGSISVDGEPVNEKCIKSYRSLFSPIFSDFYLFNELLGVDDPLLDERARYYLEKLQLSHKVRIHDGKLSTTDLSQGQRQRLALLTTLMDDRPICVFDEWAAGQDPNFKKIFYEEFLPELRDSGKLIIASSHDDAYFSTADRLIKLDYGKIKFDKVPSY